MTCTFGEFPFSESSPIIIIINIIMKLVCRCQTNLIFRDFNTFYYTYMSNFRFLFQLLPVEHDVITMASIVFVCC